MWEIVKEFDFCYGHRVWSQTLNKEFSIDGCLACRHLHGHQGRILVTLQGDHLKDGMVTDFKHLNWFKKWLDSTLDHKFIIDTNDPLRKVLFPLSEKKEYLTTHHPEGHQTISESQLYALQTAKQIDQSLVEMYEGLVIVPFVPTSENLSQWLHSIVQTKMAQIGVVCSKVQFFETPKSQSIYIAS